MSVCVCTSSRPQTHVPLCSQRASNGTQTHCLICFPHLIHQTRFLPIISSSLLSSPRRFHAPSSFPHHDLSLPTSTPAAFFITLPFFSSRSFPPYYIFPTVVDVCLLYSPFSSLILPPLLSFFLPGETHFILSLPGPPLPSRSL